jgi:hypothetical protein
VRLAVAVGPDDDRGLDVVADGFEDRVDGLADLVVAHRLVVGLVLEGRLEAVGHGAPEILNVRLPREQPEDARQAHGRRGSGGDERRAEQGRQQHPLLVQRGRSPSEVTRTVVPV